MILLDTHVWLWWLLGDGALRDSERQKLDKLAQQRVLAISWVSIWETELLERKKRITLLPDLSSWVRNAVQPGVCTVLPVDVDVVLTQRRLPENFHNDPADRLIAATALLADYPLATYDNKIRSSGVISIWNN